MLLETYPFLFVNEMSWKVNFDHQKHILYGLSKSFLEKNLDEVVDSILKSQSDIIFDLYHRIGKSVVLKSLNWSGGDPRLLKRNWLDYIVSDLQTVFIFWIKENEKKLSPEYFVLIFIRLNAKIITTLNFRHTTWIEKYNYLMGSPKINKAFVATAMLTIGFRNDIKNSEWLVAISFCDVYNFAAAHSLDNNLWNLLPKEYGDDNDQQDFNFLEEILKMLKIRPKKKHQIESWDYCEYLIRTICGKTIMYNWNPGAFLRALESPPIFYRAIDYCFTFKKGYNFVFKVWSHIASDKVQYLSFQKDYLKKVFK